MKMASIMIVFTLMNIALADCAYAEPCHPRALNLYWNSDRTDNFSTATISGESAAMDAGYRFARVMGYVCATPGRGRVPLKLYWSGDRADNFTTATASGERDAINAGYRFVRVMGYIKP